MRGERLTFLIAFAVVAVVYALTSAPGLGLVDSGELTTAAATLGIAHPTGYPLYTLLGRVGLLLAPVSPDRAMVLFSVLAGALTAAVLALFALRLLARIAWLPFWHRALIALLLSLGFALAPTAWNSVHFAEVYPLTAFLAALMLLGSLCDPAVASAPRAVHTPLIVCYLWGLAFGNHLTILWFAPLVVYVVWRWLRHAAQPKKMLALCAGLFFLGTSVNLYLPLRSAVQPLLDWSDPERLDGLIRHLGAWQYRVWMFEGGIDSLLKKFGAYFSTIPADIGWGLALLSVGGLIALFRARAGLPRALLLVWLVGVLYNLNYSIPDISTYFFALYVPLFAVAMFGVTGLLAMLPVSTGERRRRAHAVVLMALAVPAASLALSWKTADQSDYRFADSLAREILRTLPDSALVFQGNWDIQSPCLYLQYVERLRPDVVILDLSLMQRPWYLRQEMRAHPDIFAGSEAAVQTFIREVAPFEAGKPYDGRRIEAVFVAMHSQIMNTQLKQRPVYLRDAQSGHPGVGREFGKWPGAYFVRLTDTPTAEPTLDSDRIHLSANDPDPERTRYLLGEMAIVAGAQGHEAMKRGDTSTVAATLKTARLGAPANPVISDYVKRAELFLQTSTQDQNP